MRKILATLLLGGALAAASGIAAAHTSIGVGVTFGVPAPAYVAPPPVAYYPRPRVHMRRPWHTLRHRSTTHPPRSTMDRRSFTAAGTRTLIITIGAGKPAPFRKAPRGGAFAPQDLRRDMNTRRSNR